MSTYFSYNALISQRASGYQNTQYALAELIDNAFDAEAAKVKVIFFEKRDNNRRYIDEIIVCDNGKGMSHDVLETCLQFGATTSDNLDEVVAQKKKGKFGFGLPNASLSQCTNITVYSWRNGGPVYSTKLNLAELEGTKSIDIPPLLEVALPNHYERAGAVMKRESGTITTELSDWRAAQRVPQTLDRPSTHRSFRRKTAVRSSPPPSSQVHNQHLLPERSENSPSGCRLGSRPSSPASRRRNSNPARPR